MTITRINWLSLSILVGMVLMAMTLYNQLPDPMPSHWNAAGEVDDWMGKPWGVWILPMVGLGNWLLFAILPVISPRGFRLDAARRAYDILWFVMMLFLLGVQALTYLAAMGKGPGMVQVVPLMTGGLFVLIGNYLTKFPRNFFVGIRTPWTLASDEVWNRTHRLGSWVFILAGLLIAFTAFLPSALVPLVIAIGIAVAVPVVYSFVLYRKLHGFEAENE